jgi:uncharacterized CHY-type Zn-finger protein
MKQTKYKKFICGVCARTFEVDKDYLHDLKSCPYCCEKKLLKEGILKHI